MDGFLRDARISVYMLLDVAQISAAGWPGTTLSDRLGCFGPEAEIRCETGPG